MTVLSSLVVTSIGSNTQKLTWEEKVPPKDFRPSGEIVSAERDKIGPYFSKEKAKQDVPRAKSAARKAGIAYEKKVQAKLSSEFHGFTLYHNPWLRFVSDVGGALYFQGKQLGRSHRFCQPDSVVVTRDHVIVFEIKVRHTERAWWQLHELYAPVCVHVWKKRVIMVEITKSYDSRVLWPGESGPNVVFDWVNLKREIVRVSQIVGSDVVIVLQWRPGEE